jgi:hypothetical protein
MLKTGRSSLAGVPGGRVRPSSTMVPTPWPSTMTAPTGLLRLMLKVSGPSKVPSLVMATVMVWLATPAAKFRLPAATL